MDTTFRLSRHSRENGNPEPFSCLDSRLRGSDDSSLRLKLALDSIGGRGVSTIPDGDTKLSYGSAVQDGRFVGSNNLSPSEIKRPALFDSLLLFEITRHLFPATIL